MRNPSDIMRLKLPDHLPVLPNNADPSIVRPEEEAVGTGADARDLVALEELLGFIVGERDLGDFEEVERLPLSL